jgi:hydrogenase/urease accessory protein HupE
LSGDCLPAAIAIHEKIREENAGNNFAAGVNHPVQAANKAGVTVDVGVHVLEAIRSVARLGRPGKRFCAIVQSAIYVGILELIGEKAADGLYVIMIERLGPFFFL